MLEKTVVSTESGSHSVMELHEMNRDSCFIKVELCQICVIVIVIVVIIIIFIGLKCLKYKIPKLWNKLPTDLKEQTLLNIFKNEFKLYLITKLYLAGHLLVQTMPWFPGYRDSLVHFIICRILYYLFSVAK